MAKKSGVPGNEEQARAYIFDVIRGLIKVAKAHNITFLVYLLEIVGLAAAPTNKSNKKD